MTWIFVVRGVYLLVSLAVALTAAWLSGRTVLRRDRAAGLAFAAYALSTAAAQCYALSKPITLGTVFVGFGVLAGAAWLIVLRFEYRKEEVT